MLYDRWIKRMEVSTCWKFLPTRFVLSLLLQLLWMLSFRKKDRIIIVPPKIEKAVWVETNKVSDAYLEQMGIFFATFVCNMSPINAEYNAKIISEYTDISSRKSKNEIMAQTAILKRIMLRRRFSWSS